MTDTRKHIPKNIDFLLKITSLVTYDTYFGTFMYYITSIQQTELAQPLLYHGDANANNFMEANSFLFCRIAYQ